jgi:maltooligosyltrehalose trehalohydrolase
VTRLSVWAPAASHVDAVVDGVAHPMSPAADGWWCTDVDAAAGADYGFALDGGEALPDPRSAWQPAGVHGPSRLVDHAAFGWRHDTWQGAPILDGVCYELHVGTFTPQGSFAAAADRLVQLVALGVDAVEILPVAAFPGERGWGYDGVCPYAVQDCYGGPEGLKRFVDACHGRGLRVILDVVYNHLGPDGNVLGRYGPYFTDEHSTPWGAAVNYCEADSDEVRRYVLDNAAMWLRDYRFDGLRLDAVHAIMDTGATHILEQLAVVVDALAQHLQRPLTLIAESDQNDPRIVNDPAAGGYGVHAQWSDDFHHALHAALTGERFGYYADFGSLTDVATALRRGFVHAGEYSVYRRRHHGRPLPVGTPAHRLLGYAQDHDQVGNRARGERLAALVSPGLAKVAAALVLTGPFTPMLFMGEEWGASTPWQYFTDHRDPVLAEAVRTGRRAEFAAFGWEPASVPDPQDPATAANSTLDWSEPKCEPHAGMLVWYRDLIALRRARPALRGDRFEQVNVSVDEAARLLVMHRGDTIVVANLSEHPQQVDVTGQRVLLSSSSATLDRGVLRLDGESVAIVATAP